jgi:hypothetical protein
LLRQLQNVTRLQSEKLKAASKSCCPQDLDAPSHPQ